MKTPRIINAMENIDEELISEAVSYTPNKKIIPVWTKFLAVAACFCLCIIGAFKLWNPGMGATMEVRNIAVSGENVYYSVWNEGAFLWNPSMKAPEKLEDDGRFFETDAGLILYSAADDMLWQVNGNNLITIGNAEIQNTLDSPALIGIMDDFAYWVGNRIDLPKDNFGMAIVRASLTGGQTEMIVSTTNGGITSCAIRKDNLYYKVYEEPDARSEKLYSRNLITNEEKLLTKLDIDVDGISGQIYYTENYIIIVGGSSEGIYKMEYEGGEPQLLTDIVPITSAMDEWDGQIYFETAFGENESYEFACGNGYYSEEFVSVDLESGKITKIAGFNLGNDNGTTRFTVSELAMTDDGFYFTDPISGLFFHSFKDGTDTPIP